MADLRQKRPAMAGSREIGMFVFLVVLFCFPLLMGHKARQSFYGSYNLVLLLRHVGMLSIFAIGETFVIITAGIDLSVGSVIALSGVLCGYGLTEAGLPAGCVIAGVLAVGVLIGLFHGFLVVHVRIQPFVATLGTLCVLRSLGMVLTDSLAISITDPGFLALGKIPQGWPPTPLMIMVPIAAAAMILMHATVYGRYLYAIGSNEEATRLSGVRTGRIKYMAYVLSSLLAAAAGIVYASYAGMGDPSSGQGYELNAIAAAVIGGCSLAGGEGSVAGTLIGASILLLIVNELNLLIERNASLWEGFIVGAVVIAAVALNTLRQRRAR